MSLQLIFDTAQNIEFTRLGMVAQSMSRSGRLYTQERNFAKPWQFTITPAPVYPWAGYRELFEKIFENDKSTEHEILVCGTANSSAWMWKSLGNHQLHTLPNVTDTNNLNGNVNGGYLQDAATITAVNGRSNFKR